VIWQVFIDESIFREGPLIIVMEFPLECFVESPTAWNVLSYTSTRPLVKFAVYRKRLPSTKALVRPVKLDPSLVLTTVTALVDGGAEP
jgi:hypothetical protein